MSAGGTRTRPAPESSANLRGQLTNLRALLVLSILMTESADVEQILRLAASSASSLGGWRVAGFALGDTWHTGTGGGLDLAAELSGQVDALPASGGPVGVDGAAWAWAYPLRSIASDRSVASARRTGLPRRSASAVSGGSPR